jgi:plastocyanin
MRKITVFFLLSLVALGAACGKGEEGAAPAGPVYKATGNEGSITGTIAFTGAMPAAKTLDTASDVKCGEVVLDDVQAANGKLQNVFVYVMSGLPQAAFETPATEVTLDQKGCRFVPRVLGVQTGQVVRILNSDMTNHNVHPIPRVNKEWNESQLAGQGPIRRGFSKEEVMIPVKCNQHPWMLAHIAVLNHPFFAVSDAAGSFTIKGLPPGEYEIEAWHEKYGAKTIRIKVEPKADAKADFTYEASAAWQAGSLKMQPALVIP